MPMPKLKKAVALKYDQAKQNAPIVIASGYGPIAEQIIHLDKKLGIPVYEDEHSAGLLTMLKLGESIPVELYQVIAEIYTQLLIGAEKIREKNG